MQSLNYILKSFIRDYGLEGGVAMNAIRHQWKNIVGPAISAHTYADTLKGQVLTITVDTPQWIHHLSFFKGDIISKLNAYAVSDVRFRIGRIPEEEKAAVSAEHAELSEDDQRYIENTLKNLNDEELREKFRTLIIHGLSRGKRVSPK